MRHSRKQRLKWIIGNFIAVIGVLSALMYLNTRLSFEMTLGLATLVFVLLCIVNVVASRFADNDEEPQATPMAEPPKASGFEQELEKLRGDGQERRERMRDQR